MENCIFDPASVDARNESLADVVDTIECCSMQDETALGDDGSRRHLRSPVVPAVFSVNVAFSWTRGDVQINPERVLEQLSERRSPKTISMEMVWNCLNQYRWAFQGDNIP